MIHCIDLIFDEFYCEKKDCRANSWIGSDFLVSQENIKHNKMSTTYIAEQPADQPFWDMFFLGNRNYEEEGFKKTSLLFNMIMPFFLVSGSFWSPLVFKNLAMKRDLLYIYRNLYSITIVTPTSRVSWHRRGRCHTGTRSGRCKVFLFHFT